MQTFNEDIAVTTWDGKPRIRLDAGHPLTGPDPETHERIRIDGDRASIVLRDDQLHRRLELDGLGANILLGGNGADGDLMIFNNTPFFVAETKKATVHIDGQTADIWVGGNGTNGDLMLFKADAPNPRDQTTAAIWLSAKDGDIRLQNGDCAEEFEVAAGGDITPGTVMVITEEGALAPCEKAYDRRVAGVVAGAAGSRPAIVLGARESANRRLPVALIGRVFCNVDADEAPIQIGDLLTTATTPGHAMRVTDAAQGFGAVLGKALGRLDRGKGLIPVLIALQ